MVNLTASNQTIIMAHIFTEDAGFVISTYCPAFGFFSSFSKKSSKLLLPPDYVRPSDWPP